MDFVEAGGTVLSGVFLQVGVWCEIRKTVELSHMRQVWV